MSSAALQQLAALSGVTTFAALFVALARAPLRSLLGARAAYWIWLTLPVSALALLLPRAARPPGAATPVVRGLFSWLTARMDALIAAAHVSGPPAAATLAAWIVGAAAAAVLIVLRQRACVRSLGKLVRSRDGTWRGRGVAEPMLIGVLRPRVLLPADFELRYSAEERRLILAHERAHVRRGDTAVNAFAAAWICVFWFNPVMLWAMRLLRFDQDLACDAAVLVAAGRGGRSRYAQALLKAQLAGERVLPLSLACHWRSAHPLRRRIAALKCPAAGRMRHSVGIVFVTALAASASLAAHAVQPARAATTAGPPTATHGSGKVCPLTLRRAHAHLQARPTR